jgi:hypothetical protein
VRDTYPSRERLHPCPESLIPASECRIKIIAAVHKPGAGFYTVADLHSSVDRVHNVKLREAGYGDWTGPLYQFANRLAHLYFLREVARVPAWFVNVCFTSDPHRPSALQAWEEALQAAKEALGLGQRSIPYCADVFLEAAGRELFE